MESKIICSKCKSNNIIKWCKRKTENRGLIQRYRCKDCLNTFVLDDKVSFELIDVIKRLEEDIKDKSRELN